MLNQNVAVEAVVAKENRSNLSIIISGVYKPFENDSDQAQFSTSAKIKVEGSPARETRFQLVVVRTTLLNARTTILRCEEDAFLCQNEMGAWYHCRGQGT